MDKKITSHWSSKVNAMFWHLMTEVDTKIVDSKQQQFGFIVWENDSIKTKTQLDTLIDIGDRSKCQKNKKGDFSCLSNQK